MLVWDKISETRTQPTFLAKISSCNLSDDKNSTKIFSSYTAASFLLTAFSLGILPLFFCAGPSTETVDRTLPFGPPLFICYKGNNIWTNKNQCEENNNLKLLLL